jgi:hypothetical protein
LKVWRSKNAIIIVSTYWYLMAESMQFAEQFNIGESQVKSTLSENKKGTEISL